MTHDPMPQPRTSESYLDELCGRRARGDVTNPWLLLPWAAIAGRVGSSTLGAGIAIGIAKLTGVL